MQPKVKKSAQLDPALFWEAVAHSLSKADQMGTVSAIVTRAAREIAGADGTTFVLKEGDFCHYFDESAISGLWKGRKFPANTCISGWAMIHKQPVVIRDVFSDPRIPVEAYKPTFVKSLCMTPVRQKDPIAAIGCYWKDHYVPTPNQVQGLQTLANLAAISIQKITLDSQLQKEVIQNSNLASKNKELELYIHTLAHDLRSPLATLTLLYSQIEEAIAGKNLGLEPSLGVVQRTTDRMATQLNRILALYRMNEGGVVKSQVDLGPMLNEIFKQFRMQYSDGETKISTSGDLNAFCDPELMYIVLENLISNAFKYFRRDSPREIRVETIRKNKEDVFRIEDNGVGFDQTQAAKLFQPLGRLHAESEFQGTGLGLASCAKIVAKHGGRIWAEGRINVGSKFYVALPSADV